MKTNRQTIKFQREVLRMILWSTWEDHYKVMRFSSRENLAAFAACCETDELPEQRKLAQQIGKARGLKFPPVRSEIIDAANTFKKLFSER